MISTWAVSMPNSDSLGRITGIVYMYEKVNAEWKKIATLAPSNPVDAMQFGYNMVLSKNYLLVSSLNYGGAVYIFKKGAAGWASQTELTTLKIIGSYYFGTNPYGNPSVAISEDEQTIAITDFYAPVTLPSVTPYYMGAIYVYHKNTFQEWNNTISSTRIIAPDDNIADFGRAGVALFGNYLVTGSPYTDEAGNLFVYHDPSANFSNFLFKATLRSVNLTSIFLGYYNLLFTSDGIFTPAVESNNGEWNYKIAFFKTPTSGNWVDSAPTCYFEAGQVPTFFRTGKILLSNHGGDILASFRDADETGYFNIIKKGVNGWCEPTYQTIDITPVLSGQVRNSYGFVIASNQTTDAVLGFVPIPGNLNATLALKTLAYDGTKWNSSLLYPSKKSTAGHYYGSTLLGFDNHLFAASPGDGTIKSSGGAVYYYEKNGGEWIKKTKLTAPDPARYDDWFGSAMATNKKHLAVGASGYESGQTAYGRVFIYKKPESGWAQAELVQEISLPEDKLSVYAYGDNLAMNDEWLAIPYVQLNLFRVMIAIYNFNGNEWKYFQVVETSLGNFFAKTTTVAVSIYGETLLAGNLIIERNNMDVWGVRHELSPSDPESMQIAPDFSHWITNGSMFGHSNAISENTIFIGAPIKDHEGTWDVGAVYVYTKRPGESWSSRTETRKLLPRVKHERELFGYSLHNSFNTLLVGTPGSDFIKDGVTARNKPGRAYVFQSRDYFWNDVIPLIDFAGDSFVKDYYGIDVYVDESDFFIGAAIEDIETGKLSGSVYITPSPPIIKLVPPICSDEGIIDLFGYPFGGVWTGPGIIDATEGTFDPKVAGIGIHEFRYRTPNCAYEGILNIEIVAPIIVKLFSETAIQVCRDKLISMPLAVEPQLNVRYSWYYRSSSTQSFSPLEIYSSSMNATKRGEYQIKVFNDVCDVFSPIITISDEQVIIEIASPLKACEKSSADIPLLATPAGGMWSGNGVNNNNFNPSGLNAGIYKITYQYISPVGCIYKSEVNMTIVPIFTPVIARLSGNLCEEGKVTLTIQGMPPEGNRIAWTLTDAMGTHVLNENDNSITTTKHGTYSVVVDNGVCKISSLPFSLNDQLNINLQPSDKYKEVCAEDNISMTIDALQNATYTWFYNEHSDKDFHALPESTNSLAIKKSGYYKLEVNKGACQYLTDPKQVLIHPKDSIFMPNVFTPNGDDKNEVLKITGTIDDAQLLVINRYGSQMFEGSAVQGWTGDNASAGVYFWLVQYQSCYKEDKKLKGTVHLIR